MLTKKDVMWVVNFVATDESREESKQLRTKVAKLEETVIKKEVDALAPPARILK